MSMRTFSVTLSGSGSISKGKLKRGAVYDLSVRPNLATGGVVCTFTLSCAFTGEVLRSTSFGTDGRGVLPTLEQLRPMLPAELHGMLRNIWPSLGEFVHPLASELHQARLKG